MQKVVRRQCTSQKDCSDCGREIAVGEYYYNNPNISLCEACNEKAKALKAAEESKPADVKNDDYPELGPCEHCDNNAENTIKGIPVCNDHVQLALDNSG